MKQYAFGMQCGEEYYAIVFDRKSCMHALVQLTDWATDPELSFDWYDAAVLSDNIDKALFSEWPQYKQ